MTLRCHRGEKRGKYISVAEKNVVAELSSEAGMKKNGDGAKARERGQEQSDWVENGRTVLWMGLNRERGGRRGAGRSGSATKRLGSGPCGRNMG